MTPQVKLTRGNTSLDLTAAPYSVGMDFAPPAVNPAYNISAGTSANRTGGGTLISDRYNNRQFSFSLRILSTSSTGAHAAARAVSAFVKATSASPLYLEYRENTSIPVPLWGQLGAPLRYEVVTADVGAPENGYTETGARGWFVQLSMDVKPFAVGNRQKLAHANGGVFEDNYGMPDGTPRGVAMFRGTTNKMTNPIFGSATYSTGWTAGSNLIISKNQDPRFCLPNVAQSVKITARAATNNTFTQSINAGNTNDHAFSAYIIMPDGGAPTTSDVVLYYGTEITTTFFHIGGSLWMAYNDDYTATNAAVNTGIQVKSGRTVYLLGYQFEELKYHTYLCHGDLLGCSWNGTVHASTSTRSQPWLDLSREDSNVSIAEGAVSIVMKAGLDAIYIDLDQFHFVLYGTGYGGSGLAAWREQSDERIYFTDGTNTIDSGSSVIWDAGDVNHLVYTWGPGGLNVYLNGANIATGATYTPADLASQAQLVIAESADCVVMGFDVYGEEINSSQVSAIYAALSGAVTAGRRVSAIPYLWTDIGTIGGVASIYNHSDSGAGHKNWSVISGVDGSAPAQYSHYFTSSTTTKTAYWLGGYSIPCGPFDNPSVQWYEDESGTVDANSSGGEYETDGTSPFDYAVTMSRNTANTYSFFMRMGGSGAGTITVTPYLQSGSGLITGTPKACTVSTTQTLYYIGTMTLDNQREFENDLFYPADNISAVFHGEYTGISSRVDFVMVIPDNLIKIDQGVNNAIGASQDYINYNGKNAYLFTVAGVLSARVPVWGTELVIHPNRLNFLWVVIGDHGEAHVITDYINLTTYISPRYGLV
jgi:hypothetical protein